MAFHKVAFLLTISCCMISVTICDTKPNIVFIISDDMGWNDVSHHGSDIVPTPNIDVLGYDGRFLQRYYTYGVCSPTRATLLTGQYSHKMGMQGYPMRYGENRAIPHSIKLLPAYLKDEGYATHLVGKWHAGMSRQQELPTNRGFDSHFGFRGGFVDYYEYINEQAVFFNDSTFSGLDLFNNLTPDWETTGYLTKVLTDKAINVIETHDKSKPLFLYLGHPAPHSENAAALMEAPEESIRANRHIRRLGRRIFAAMVRELDISIGKVVESLEKQNILNNTIIVFVSDNGGVPTGNFINYGSNLPFRGMKFASYEGGVRVPALLWSPTLKSDGNNIWQGLMHVSDWMPTILEAVNATNIPEGLDGISQWSNIHNDIEERTEVVVDIDDVQNLRSLISGEYKLLIGNSTGIVNIQFDEDFNALNSNPPVYEDLLVNSNVYKSLKNIGREVSIDKAKAIRDAITVTCETKELADLCLPTQEKPCLFNIIQDPCELNDIASEYPDIVASMIARLDEEWEKRIPRSGVGAVEPGADPTFFNNVWETWLPDEA